MVPTAATVPGPEPEMAAKNVQARMVVMLMAAPFWIPLMALTWFILTRGIPADVPERVRQVRDNAHRNAEALGLDGAFYEEIWAQLIQRAIAYEKAQLGEA